MAGLAELRLLGTLRGASFTYRAFDRIDVSLSRTGGFVSVTRKAEVRVTNDSHRCPPKLLYNQSLCKMKQLVLDSGWESPVHNVLYLYSHRYALVYYINQRELYNRKKHKRKQKLTARSILRQPVVMYQHSSINLTRFTDTVPFSKET